MTIHDATEQAYKNGYAQGKRDAMKWIPVTEPPKEKGRYLVTVKHWLDGRPVSQEARWNGVDWFTVRVTHWMPLPEPLKEDA